MNNYSNLLYELHAIQTLINLVKVDNQIQASEIAFLEGRIHQSPLAEDVKQALRANLASTETFDKPFEIFKSSPEQAQRLVGEILRLAKADNYMSLTERIYLRQVFRGLGLDENQILSLLVN